LAQTGRPSNILDNQKKLNVPFGGAYPLDMFCHPLNFLSPEFFISEAVNGINPDGKFIGVWKLSVMLGEDGKRLIVPDHLTAKARHLVVFWTEMLQAASRARTQ
jgi:hypothetical protein